MQRILRQQSNLIDFLNTPPSDGPLVGCEPLPPLSTDETPSPHALLADGALVGGRFEPAGGTHGETQPIAAEGDSLTQFTRTRACRQYELADKQLSGTRITTQVKVLPAEQRTDEKRTAMHEDTLQREFGRNYLEDRTTDWVDTEITESTVDGFRRTTCWSRVPILSKARADDLPDTRPCGEGAIIVQSVSWGTLELGVRFVPAERERQAIETAERIIDAQYEQVQDVPAPVTDASEYRPTQTEEALNGEVEMTVPWSEMSETEQERVTLAAIERRSEHSPGVMAEVQRLLESRYDAPTDVTDVTIEKLVDERVVTEPPETLLRRSGPD